MLVPADYWSAMSELDSLRHYCQVTGEDLRSLIAVPADTERLLQAFARTSVEAARIVDHALEFRAMMLAHVGDEP